MRQSIKRILQLGVSGALLMTPVPAIAFIDPATDPVYSGVNSSYAQYQFPNPYIGLQGVAHAIGTRIETANVIYSGTYRTGPWGLWQVGSPSDTMPGGFLDFWSNNGNNPVLSLSFGEGSSMKSYVGLASRRITSGNVLEAFVWTQIDATAYWQNFDSTTYTSSVIAPAPSTEQYLLWVAAPQYSNQQTNSAPVLASLQQELLDQINDGCGTATTACVDSAGASATSSGGGSGGGSGTTSEVPGPLPVLGLAAAFAWSRRLRRVIRKATQEPMTAA